MKKQRISIMEKNKSYQIRINIFLNVVLFFLTIVPLDFAQNLVPVVPPEWRGDIDAERIGHHDANIIRTRFRTYGMVGDYPDDPQNVDLSIFHSMEIPKGSGENYSDGATPFVLAKILQTNGNISHIMETGYRERQGISPYTNKTMRFEPRFGYLQIDPTINLAESPAMSNDSRTWPDQWYDKLDDPDDPGWSGSWNGYFGKEPKADQESYHVVDDNFYDAWFYYPDSRDNTRRGLGLRVGIRGFQWSNPQAGRVLFFHYDITNESTTKYDKNIIFGMYMDTGVGGSGLGPNGFFESDDDNAFFDKSFDLNLVYTWDNYGNGVQGPTGYLGYSYLETPGNPTDFIDNDVDGITDEKRDSGPGIEIIGQESIMNYLLSNYDIAKFEALNGPITLRPAYLTGVWWTGDEDLDWVAEYYDTGGDGVFGTGDTGEKDNMPTLGETNFDRTDIDESDMIGLTGFKLNRIKSAPGNPSSEVDDINFYYGTVNWPERLYNIFTNPDSAFGAPLALNYNIGFLFASGPFVLDAGKTERFSLALGFGQNLRELETTTRVVQQIYEANYQFAVPPPMPTLSSFSGDEFVTLTWDNVSERAFDPITNNNDFEGYRIYRSTDPTFLDPQVILTGTGTGPIGNGKPIAQFDLVNDISGFSETTVEGVAYFLGEDTGITHSWKDTTVTNGQRYFYAVTSYDRGVDSILIYPSENSITVSQTLRAGFVLPKNVVEVTPNPPVVGYTNAAINNLSHEDGNGSGTVELLILNSAAVPDDHLLQLFFDNPADSVRAQSYGLTDVTVGDTLFLYGSDLLAEGNGPSGAGILPIINTALTLQIDSANTQFIKSTSTNLNLSNRYSTSLPIELRRPGFPEDIDVIFSDEILDTSIAGIGLPSKPTKFKVIAKTKNGDLKLKFKVFDQNNLGTLSKAGDYIDILTPDPSNLTSLKSTWRVEIDTTGLAGETIIPAGNGDVFEMRFLIPFSSDDKFTFKTVAQSIDGSLASSEFSKQPYVVPNPYTGAASFEPQRFAVTGRGERKIEFRNLPANCTIRIYTLTGELVNTLHHDGNITAGVVAWDLRNSSQLEIAPGLYIYHVDGGELGTFIGKFAIIK